MSPESGRPNAEKTNQSPGVIRRQTALALPHIRQRWAQITQAARQMVRTRRPELLPRLERLKKFAGSLQSRQHPLHGELHPAKKRPPTWQSMDMVLPNGSSLEEAQPDFMLRDLAAGLPAMGLPAAAGGQVLPPFESSGSYGQRSLESKPKVPEAPARRWKKPAPGSRLHSKVEEIHSGVPGEPTEKEPEKAAPHPPQQPSLPPVPPPAKAPQGPASPAAAAEPLLLPRRPRSRIEELPARPLGPEDEPPEVPLSDSSGGPGGPEPRGPARPLLVPRTPPDTIQRQSLPQAPAASPLPEMPAYPDLPQHSPAVPEEKHAPASSAEPKRPLARSPQAEPEAAAETPTGLPAALSARAGRPGWSVPGFKPTLRKAPPLKRGAASGHSPLFLRQPRRPALPPLMLLRCRAGEGPASPADAPISGAPARTPRAAALPGTSRPFQTLRANAPGILPASQLEPTQSLDGAFPVSHQAPHLHPSPRPEGVTGETPEAALMPPVEAAGDSPETAQIQPADENPLPAPALPKLPPGLPVHLSQARPAALGMPIHPSLAELISPLQHTVALRKPLIPVNADRPDLGAAALPAEVPPVFPASVTEAPAGAIERDALSQAQAEVLTPQPAGATQRPQGEVHPTYRTARRRGRTAYSRIEAGERSTGSAPRPTGAKGFPSRRTSAIPTLPDVENLILPPPAAARRIVFRAPLVSWPGRERILNPSGRKAARAGAAVSYRAPGSVRTPEPSGEASAAEFILAEAAAGRGAVPFLAQPGGEATSIPVVQPYRRPDLDLASLEMPPLRGRSQPEAGAQAEPGPSSPPASAAPAWPGSAVAAGAARPTSGGGVPGATAAKSLPAQQAQPPGEVARAGRTTEPSAYIQREEEGPFVPAAEEPQEPAPDPRELAKLVYPIIKRMLAQEKERLRGSS